MSKPQFKLISTLALILTTAAVSAADAKLPRAARSVHLGYPGPEGAMFYNEAVVEQSVPGSYFMACGWSGGYFGIQQLANNDKVVIFSVWDPTKGDNSNAVPLEKRVEVLYEGEGVEVSRFGGEGTGGKSFFHHPWKTGETNRFLVEARVEGQKTAYTGWFFLNEKAAWKKLVTFRTTTGGSPLKGYYSFVEDFRRDGRSVNEVRRARFGNGWIKSVKGEWAALDHARFTASRAEWESKENINAGTADPGWYFLATGGDTKMVSPLNGTITRTGSGFTPPNLEGLEAPKTK